MRKDYPSQTVYIFFSPEIMNAYVHGLEEVCQSDRLKTEVST